MNFDPKKIVLNRVLTVEEGLAVYHIMRDILSKDEDGEFYYYITVTEDSLIDVQSVRSVEVDWLSKKMNIKKREAVICICEFDGFWEDLKDILHFNQINDYKRYFVFTKEDILGEGDQDFTEYIGTSEEDAMEFYRDVMMVENIVSVMPDEDET